MALTGKSSLSLRKQDLQNETSASIGFQKLVFATQVVGGDTGIDLTALIGPPSMASLGFANPGTISIAGASLKFNRRNLTLTSSLRGMLIDYLAYDVASSTRINFLGFTAQPGEIFVGVLDDNPKTNLLAVDAQPIVATGVLSANTTDFNVGTPFKVGAFSTTSQVGLVLVFKDGVQQFRNTNNATAAPGADGNYQEVDPGGGLGVIIRFNVADSNPHNIVVFNPGVAERPDGSMMAVIENLAGQLDQLIPTVADLAGVPQSDFQVAPNSVDLKAFGDTVTAQGVELANHEARIEVLEAPIRSRARLWSFLGFGTTNTFVETFASTLIVGTNLSVVHDASLGDSIVVNSDGLYNIYTHAQNSITGDYQAVVLNVTNIITNDDLSTLVYCEAPAVSRVEAASKSIFLPAGSVLRAVAIGGPTDVVFEVNQVGH